MHTVESFIRPSALPSLALCPGAAKMQAHVLNNICDGGYVEEESEEASVGTKIHDAAQVGVESYIAGMDWENAIGHAKAYAVNQLGLSPWDVIYAERCLGFAQELIAKYEIEREDILVEHKLNMEYFGLRGGTADLVLIVPYKLVIVVDWKCGFLDQGEASEHDQLQAYGSAAADTFKSKKAMVYLFQPRMDTNIRASGATFDLSAIEKNKAWTQQVVNAARAENPELNPSYDACKYCKALGRCHAAKEWIMNVFEAIDLLGPAENPHCWGELIGATKVAEKACENLVGMAKAYMAAGGKAEGWQLCPSGNGSKVDNKMVVEIAKEKGQLEQVVEYASFKVELARTIPGYEKAVISFEKSPSLRPAKSKGK